MTVDRELLWQAWPKGYLSVPGLRTIGGWMCVSVHDDFGCFHLVYGQKRRVCFLGRVPYGYLTEEKLAVGDFLPVVDPTDIATWAAVKDDLARVVWPKETQCTGVVFTSLLSPDEWVLSCYVGVADTRSHSFRTTQHDYATALVEARIEIRKEFGR